MTYQCAECGLAVILPEGEPPIRACPHETAAILANASATLEGFGGLL